MQIFMYYYSYLGSNYLAIEIGPRASALSLPFIFAGIIGLSIAFQIHEKGLHEEEQTISIIDNRHLVSIKGR